MQLIAAGFGGDDYLGWLGVFGAAAVAHPTDLRDRFGAGNSEVGAAADSVDRGPSRRLEWIQLRAVGYHLHGAAAPLREISANCVRGAEGNAGRLADERLHFPHVRRQVLQLDFIA